MAAVVVPSVYKISIFTIDFNSRRMTVKKERKMKVRRTKTTVEKKMEKRRRKKVKKVLGRIKLTRRELLQARIEMSSFVEMKPPLLSVLALLSLV